MTADQKKRFLNAIEEIEEREGIDAPLSPTAILRLAQSHFPDLWAEVEKPFAEAMALQMIASRGGPATRKRRLAAAQMTLALPGFQAVKIPVTIRVPENTNKGEMGRGGRGHWGKTLKVPVKDFGLYVRSQEQRFKDASLRQQEKLKPLRELYRLARVGAKGDFSMPLKDALASQSAKQKAKALGLGTGWLFGMDATARE